jgi:hypothetical protein
MIGTTLVELRTHIDALASADGDYHVVCGRTGDRPVPVAGKRFDKRATARSAARAAEQYRTALRRYDPRVPRYDPIVCQDTGPLWTTDRTQQSGESHQRSLSEPVLDGGAPTADRRDRVEFCHRAAGAVFETLSEGGYSSVESAVVDAYLELAEALTDPDDLCLRLLESVATEFGRQLTPADQSGILAGAASRLPATDSADQPVSAALSTLERRGLLGSYVRSPWSTDLAGGTRSVVARLSGYALSPRQDRLPVLPLALELYRHDPGWRPVSMDAVDVDDGWRLTLVLARDTEPSGLASAPHPVRGVVCR